MIRWSEDLELGDKEIDAQHRMLIQTLEDMYEACSRGEGLNYLEGCIEYIEDYVDMHFKQEEAIQKKYNYPNYEMHRLIHEGYRKTMKKIVNRADGKYTMQDLSEVIQYLTKMIVEHIRKEDSDIARHIRGEKSELVLNSSSLTKDKLTGVLDESGIYKLLENKMKNKDKSYIYIGINIINFQQVNDTYGFDIGDQVLIYIAGSLQIFCEKAVAIGRIYGDRFGIVLEQDRPETEILKELNQVKQKIESGFRRKGGIIPLKVCMGLAYYPEGIGHLRELRQAVNIALTQSSLQRGNPIVEYKEEMKQSIQQKSKLIQLMQPYCLKKNLRVVYQPICSVQTGEIKGCEALLRLRDDKGETISPLEFIPLAEAHGLINDLTYFCIKEVGDLLREVPKEKLGYVSVNLSPNQFENSKFIQYIDAFSKAENIEMNRMAFEIVESAIVENFEGITEALRAFRMLGSEVLIDDFGLAYSALSYLSRMEVDTIKIDKSFVDDILVNEKSKIILGEIIVLAHKIGLGVVVEGVEQTAQWEVLKELQVDKVQGYLFSKPLERNELIRKLLE